jgi:hypothetical protein
MKKFLALTALVAVALTACDKGNTEPTYSSKIELNKSEVTFAKGGGEEIVTFMLVNGQGGRLLQRLMLSGSQHVQSLTQR